MNFQFQGNHWKEECLLSENTQARTFYHLPLKSHRSCTERLFHVKNVIFFEKNEFLIVYL